MAMYEVKRPDEPGLRGRTGRNGQTTRFAMNNDLHVALERRNLHLAYQPVFDPSDRCRSG